MSDPNTKALPGADWTRLLADPDLVGHLGTLLQTYREAPVEQREEALLAAMREIKSVPPQGSEPAVKSVDSAQPLPGPVTTTPPFEPDLFSTNWSSDRRRHPRIKCFVAVEIRVDGSSSPIWGNLSNTSAGGCLVETANPVQSGAEVEIGLWLPNGKLWVKGFALTGVVTRSGPTTGVRVRFAGMSPADRENLRQFLKFVQDTIRASKSENSYIQMLK